jgi:hypothetical protein
MGTDPDFFTDAIEGRVDDYYDLAMGGTAVSGNDNALAINDITVSYLQANPFGTAATFTVESNTLDPERISAEITATATATEPLSTGMRFHVAVVETNVDHVALYGAPTGNGQTNIYYVVRELLTGADGMSLPAMQTGDTESFTGTYERDASVQNADSLRVTTWIQNESTKEILAGGETFTSVIPDPSPIINKSNNIMNVSPLVYSTNKGRIVVVLPFSNARVTLYNINGRRLEQYQLSGSAGQKAIIPQPKVNGLLLLRLTSDSGRTTLHRILSK